MGSACCWLFLLISLIEYTHNCGAANILGLFPHHGYSHFKVFYPIMRSLSERGHNVTVVSYISTPESNKSNFEEFVLSGGKETVNVFRLDQFTPSRSLNAIIREFFQLHEEGQESCEIFYQSGYVNRILERHKLVPYDIVIMELFNTDCYVGVPYLLQVPVVGLSSCALMPWHYDRILLPNMPSHVQSEFVGFPEQLNWHQRLFNFLQSNINTLLYRYYTNYYDEKIIKKYLNIDLSVDEVCKNITSLIFVNQHYTLSGNRPITPQLVEMGGIHVEEENLNQPLPQRIDNFLEKVPNDTGVLFISWGSMLRTSSISPETLQTILNVLQKLPFSIIWKWEDEKEIPIQSEQFLFIKWAPQLPLLCHPKIKLFWGHGGLLGTTEAVYCGKPMIVTPIYGDQFLNAYAVFNRMVGVIQSYDDIDEKHLELVFQTVMQNRYADNAKALSKVFRSRNVPPIESVMWWIEFLLEHGQLGRDILHTKAVRLNWFVYYSIDSLMLLLLPIIFSAVFLKYATRLLCSDRMRYTKLKTN